MKKTISLFLCLLFLPLTLQAQNVTDDPANCAVCHQKQMKSMSNAEMLACAHSKKGITNCVVCHEPSQIATKHSNVQIGQKKFIPAKKYGPQECTKCHSDMNAVAKRTENSKVLTDSKGKVVNPHVLPATPSHQKIDCATCHRVHKKPVDINRTCYGCHHTKEYNCSGCHNQK